VAPLSAGERARVPAELGTALMARITVEEVLDANLTYVRHALPVGLGGLAGFFHRAASQAA
jgi:hypothetical protein